MGHGKIMELVVKFNNIAIMDQGEAAQLAQWKEDFEKEQLVLKLNEWRSISHYIDDICDTIRVRDENKEKTVSQLDDLITNFKTQDPDVVQLVARSMELENIIRNHVPAVDVILGKSMEQLIIKHDTKARQTCKRCK